jgi:RNA polymerase sigma factor (sigma-70 family)
VAKHPMVLRASNRSSPADYREIVVLRDLEELTIDEIAGRLSSTRETVKARLHRARALLREYLIDENSMVLICGSF